MAPPSKRFEPIQRIAKDQERKAAGSLGESLKAKQVAEQRLAELRAYHAEYLERFRAATGAGASAAQIRGYQSFLDQLETAIREQQRIANMAQQQCDRSKDQWRDRYSRSKAMDGVVERLREGERKAVDKQEQSEQDERNQRRR